jgi:squalene-hopene/tetraprenyl-beta-curcumene cyclase
MKKTALAVFALICGMTLSLPRPAQAAPTDSQDAAARAQAMIDRGLAYLKTQQQPDGGWQKPMDQPAITALVLKAFVYNHASPRDPVVTKGFDKLLSYQHPNGGIYKDAVANYNTAIAISALAAEGDPAHKPQMDQAVAFLKKLQWNDDESGDTPERKKIDKGDPNFGGFGYGKNGTRADGSNLQLALDALHDAGISCDDPAFQNAVVFVSRMQNRKASNDQPWAGDDGGFVYTPALGGESFAGEYTGPDGRRMLRSYGSMTYAGLKSLIYAGLTKDDPRVRAAYEWIQNNWTVDENPGMKLNDPATRASGLYYYYHTLAKCMNAFDQPVITDAQGTQHDWRIELIDKIATLQKPDGSWVGEKRWMEDNPVLVTAYTVLALQEATKDLSEFPAK